MATTARMVKCPHCKIPVMWQASNQFKPFCSERCRMIDFGEWVMAEKIIAGDSVYDMLESGQFDKKSDNS